MKRVVLVLWIIAGLVIFGCDMASTAHGSARSGDESRVPVTPDRIVTAANSPASPSEVPGVQCTATPGVKATGWPTGVDWPGPLLPTVTVVPLLGAVGQGTPTVGWNGVAGEHLSGTPTPEGTPTPVTTRVVGPRSVPPSPRYEPLPLLVDPKLEALVVEWLGEDIGNYGLVVKRLSDGVGVTINPDQEFYAASLFKVLVMYEVFKVRDLELLTFDETMELTPVYVDFGLGQSRWPVWSEVPIGDLLEAMITESDNAAAMMLHDRVAGWNIIQDYRAVGLEHTDIAIESMPTSAGDMALWLEMIARGKAVNEKSSQEMINLLCRQKVNDRLPALLPEGIVVAHKTGNWDGATHDVGIVYAPHGAYVIAALSNKSWESDPIAELSRLVYDYLEGESEGR